MSAVRPCEHCGGPIPESARSHAMFCSGRCKVAAYRARGTVTEQMVTPKAAWPRTVTEQTVTEPPLQADVTVSLERQTVTTGNIGEPETVTDDLPAPKFDPMDYLVLDDSGEWRVTAHGARVGLSREWLMKGAGLTIEPPIDSAGTVTEPGIIVTDDLAAIMADPILADPRWHNPIRPGGLVDDDWASTLEDEARCRLARASLRMAKGALAATLIARAA
jgi:hypothetical protein